MAKVRKRASSQGLRKEAAEALRDPLFLRFDVRNRQVFNCLKRIVVSPKIKMRKAWAELEKYERQIEFAIPEGAFELERMKASWFLGHCALLINTYRSTAPRTATEHRAHYKKLARMARDLAGAMSFDREFVHVAFVGFLKSFLRQFPEMNPRHARYASHGVQVHDLRDRLPRTSDVLKEIEEEARKIAELGPIYKQPGRKHAERNYFIVCLSRWLWEFSAKQSHAIVAAVAEAAFGGNVTNDVVRKLTASRGRLQANSD